MAIGIFFCLQKTFFSLNDPVFSPPPHQFLMAWPLVEKLFLLLPWASWPVTLWQIQIYTYRAFHTFPQIYTVNHATFSMQMYAITVQICGNFWGTQQMDMDNTTSSPCSISSLYATIHWDAKARPDNFSPRGVEGGIRYPQNRAWGGGRNSIWRAGFILSSPGYKIFEK